MRRHADSQRAHLLDMQVIFIDLGVRPRPAWLTAYRCGRTQLKHSDAISPWPRVFPTGVWVLLRQKTGFGTPNFVFADGRLLRVDLGSSGYTTMPITMRICGRRRRISLKGSRSQSVGSALGCAECFHRGLAFVACTQRPQQRRRRVRPCHPSRPPTRSALVDGGYCSVMVKLNVYGSRIGTPPRPVLLIWDTVAV